MFTLATYLALPTVAREHDSLQWWLLESDLDRRPIPAMKRRLDALTSRNAGALYVQVRFLGQRGIWN